MVVPFSGFEVPIVHLAVLLTLTAVLVALLYSAQPPLTQRTVLAMVPWVVSGAALHVFYQLGQASSDSLYPPWAEPLFGAPAVYLTTFVVMGAVWMTILIVGTTLVTLTRDSVATYLAGIGVGIMLPLLGLLAWQGISPATGTTRIAMPLLGLIASLVLSFLVYIGLGTWRTYIIAETRHVGWLVLFAHIFDGITTTIGVDVIGTTERSVVPSAIIEFAAGLPTADAIGTGWLFLVVKLLVALLVIVLFAEYVDEHPKKGNLFFAVVAFVGLGPALNNFFLFMVGI